MIQQGKLSKLLEKKNEFVTMWHVRGMDCNGTKNPNNYWRESKFKFGINIHGPQRINPNDFGDSLTFQLVPLTGQIFHLCDTDLCFTLYLLSLGVCARGGEGLQKVSDPGPGVPSLSVKPVALLLQVTLGLGLFLQLSLQVSVALYQVITVFQEALSSDALSAY